MLSGKDLGRAIEQAINKKIASGSVKSKAEVARHFKVQPPSIYDWIKKGSISKDKLPEAMEMKVGKYLKALESERKSQNITKTGT